MRKNVSTEQGAGGARVGEAVAQVQKKVEVQLPVVRLRVEDLAFLQGLQKEGVKCTIPHGRKDRLELLGLAEWKTLPPCTKEMAEWKAKKQRAINTVKLEMAKEYLNDENDEPDLDAIRHACAVYGKPQERRVFVITKAGAELLVKGSAMVQVQGGCK